MPPPPSNQKASYATMVYVRATIVEGAGWALARSVTIAVRPRSHCMPEMAAFMIPITYSSSRAPCGRHEGYLASPS